MTDETSQPSRSSLRTTEDVAAELHITIRMLRGLIAKHQPPVLKIGRSYLFDQVAFDALIEALRMPAPPRSGPPRSRGRRELTAQESYDKVMAMFPQPAAGKAPPKGSRKLPIIKDPITGAKLPRNRW